MEEQLAEGGILVIPSAEPHSQMLEAIHKVAGRLHVERLVRLPLRAAGGAGRELEGNLRRLPAAKRRAAALETAQSTLTPLAVPVDDCSTTGRSSAWLERLVRDARGRRFKSCRPDYSSNRALRRKRRRAFSLLVTRFTSPKVRFKQTESRISRRIGVV